MALSLITVGVILYAYRAYQTKMAGIKNDGVWFSSMASRGALGWIAGIFITGFYIILYWFPEYMGLRAEGPNEGLVQVFDPLSRMLSGNPASQWFVYGTLYTVAIIIFGVKFIWKYRHNRYQIIRTLSVMFFQLAFAFLIPEFLQRLSLPYNDMKNMWAAELLFL